jgi:CheY-like chemotaxis protein
MTAADAATGSETTGKRVLIVEDESMIRMLLEDMLGDLGYSVTGSVGKLDEALALAKETEFDIAILDINLNGQAVSPVADILDSRGLPYIFASGYGEQGVPDSHRDRPLLQKPFHQEALMKLLADMREQ